jgi:hypothetical protein
MQAIQTSARMPLEPAPHWAVFGTGLAILGALAVVMPLVNPEALPQHVLVTAWLPCLWVARLGWAAHRGAIRQRIGRRDVAAEIDETRWTIVLRNPTVLTRSGQPFRFRVYFSMEFVFCLVLWFAVLGPTLIKLGDA